MSNSGAKRLIWGTPWRSWLRHCATSRKVAGSIPDGVIFHFSFRPHCGSRLGSSSNRNEYQEYFLRGKDSRCVRLTSLPPSCAERLEIWDLYLFTMFCMICPSELMYFWTEIFHDFSSRPSQYAIPIYSLVYAVAKT
jgi:hypothetical protein